MTKHIIGATLIASTGMAVNTSIIISGILTILLAIYLLLSAHKRDKGIREEIKRAEKEIIQVIIKGERRKQPRK